MKKILFIDHDRYITGSTVSLRYLVDKFNENNWDVYLFTMKELEKQKYFNKVSFYFKPYSMWSYSVLKTHIADNDNLFSKEGLLLFFKNILRFFVGIWVGLKVLNKYKPDIIYLNEHVVCQFAISAAILNIPSVIHIRSQIIKGRFGIRNRLLNFVICCFNKRIFAITNEEKRQLRYNFKSIIMVPEFLKSEEYIDNINEDTMSIRKKIGLPLDKNIIIMLGGINKIKGTHQFIGAIKSVMEQNENILFLLLGDLGEELESIESKEYFNLIMKIIEKNKIQKHVLLVGMVTNVTEYILASNILVSCNLVSHFSRPVIEAWALKKAVISTDTSHSLEHMKNGYNALIVKKESKEELTEAIVTLLNNKNLLKQIGENGYQYVKEKFSADKNSNLIFDECIKLLPSAKK